MATTTNYGWTTPDDTALVKDGAAAIRTLGSSVDTTTKALNPETTLGDIAYRSSSANVKTRLGIGTTGQVLTVSGGVPAWTTVSAGGTSWTLLNSGGTALTGAATVTVSGISGKNKIMVIVTDASCTVNTAPYLKIQLNTDTGNNYYWVGNTTAAGSTYSVNNIFGTNGFPADGIFAGRFSNVDTSSMFGNFLFDGCNTTGVKTFQFSGGGSPDGGVNQRIYNGGGYYDSASTISSISVNTSAGNLDAGTVYVYTSAN